MTNEEAIAYGKRVIDLGLNDDTQAFCELAIKALETIPKYKDAYGKGWIDGAKASYEHLKMCEEEQSGDPASRKAVCEIINDIRDCISVEGYCAILERMKKLPPVNPQEPKWIPVSERLPEKNMPCLVSVGKLCLTQIAIYSDLMGTIDHRIFYQGDYGHENYVDITQYVKAWMPLPKPYEPHESDDKCKNCKYYFNPDYTRCHECKAESEELSCCTKK